jgi:GNAT superfamily N-acetyltransferase
MPIDAIKSDTRSCTPTPTPIDAIETVTLRRATPADAAMLALLGAATFLEAFTWMLPGADILAHATKNHTAEAYAAYLATPDTRITLAVTGDDAPVGFAMLTATELPSIPTFATDIELKRIYLFSRFRNAPVVNATSELICHPERSKEPASEPATMPIRPGQALMNAAIAGARALNRTRLLLGTHAGNDRAIAFYRRNGFVEAGTRTFLVGTRECCDLVMAKLL